MFRWQVGGQHRIPLHAFNFCTRRDPANLSEMKVNRPSRHGKNLTKIKYLRRTHPFTMLTCVHFSKRIGAVSRLRRARTACTSAVRTGEKMKRRRALGVLLAAALPLSGTVLG